MLPSHAFSVSSGHGANRGRLTTCDGRLWWVSICENTMYYFVLVDHISNEEVRNGTRQAFRPHEDLLTTVKRRELKWYGHVTRSTGLAKTILQGTVEGGRRRGRQKNRWEDNIPEWTGMTLGAAMRKAERREEWRELVASQCQVICSAPTVHQTTG